MVLQRESLVHVLAGTDLVTRQLQLLTFHVPARKPTGWGCGLTGRNQRRAADSRENVVHADDAVRSGGAAVVDDGGITLHPHPASML